MNPLMQAELDEWEQQEQEERQGFKVNSPESLSWAFRKLAAVKEKEDEINNIANAEISRIEHYRTTELKKLVNDRNHFEQLIRDYAASQRAANPKFKNTKTPYGTVGFTKKRPKWNYTEEALVAWLNDNGYDDLIRVKWEPNKEELKKKFQPSKDGLVVDEHGSIVEGIAVEYLEDEITIKSEG